MIDPKYRIRKEPFTGKYGGYYGVFYIEEKKENIWVRIYPDAWDIAFPNAYNRLVTYVQNTTQDSVYFDDFARRLSPVNLGEGAGDGSFILNQHQ